MAWAVSRGWGYWGVQVSVQEQLMALTPSNTPLWSAFCGHTNGVWQGRMAAFYAATGVHTLSGVCMWTDEQPPLYGRATMHFWADETPHYCCCLISLGLAGKGSCKMQ
jgi:hypothetical protein